ncbi:hypothetical protein E3Q18_00798 [Wallemia mellicola]|uniref:RA-domain-containing protein n=1 Tax=Wallemia mellicola TaxID=1708541 RepID=A0A4T0NBA1_9BASI|nr:hypothetical protein E3Q19_00791 [Wallemia mellicola]TIC01153.1 hypothetical protein E3Q18_00798 [Wallemia mellicola]TIC30643.1 hypothetical protein E3Q11_00917 [Wallemia mellicola]TIC32701.1 hypothetical protein E3Q10_01074 [Wallemia mellicola]
MLPLLQDDLRQTNVLSWSESDVSLWLQHLNYSQHLHMFKENEITGEVLVHLAVDHEALKDLGIHSVGTRLNILREIYHLKVYFDISLEPEHYVPPCGYGRAISTPTHRSSAELINETKAKVNEYTNLISKVMIQEDRLNALESDYRRLFKTFEATYDELSSIKHTSLSSTTSVNTNTSNALQSFKSPDYEHQLSPTAITVSPAPNSAPANTNTQVDSAKEEDSEDKPSNGLIRQASLGGLSRAKSYKDQEGKAKSNVKVKLDDSCWKVLPAALRKYKIDDDWTKYALFICYGKTERCLSYDERPLQLFQRLKEQGQQPVFMLRHVKELRSPISIALQKQQAKREANSSLTPPPSSSQQQSSPTTNNVASFRNGKALAEVCDSDDIEGYAIAIYPYTADREDEFDVNVSDQFEIVQRAKGWWVVRRESMNEVGWVPTGCLLEVSNLTSSPNQIQILSNSYGATALMNYQPNSKDECGLQKEDKLRVYKKHNHWCYVVKDSNGERGWAPSWCEFYFFDRGDMLTNNADIGSNKSRDTNSANQVGSSQGNMPLSAAGALTAEIDKETSSPSTPG